jgi:4-carboxymuconolactone decarboxylase
MTAEQRRVYDDVVKGPRGELRGPLLAALHRPELADKWQQLGELLRFRTSLAPRHSELAILVTAQKNDCEFEWYMHAPIAAQAGVGPDVIESIKAGQRPRFSDAADELIYEYALELCDSRHVSEAVYQRALGYLGVQGIVELTAVIGYYTMVALTLNAHEFQAPEKAPSSKQIA